MLKSRRAQTLKALELRKLLNVSKGDDNGLSIVQQVSNGLSTLGLEVLEDSDTRSITLRKQRRKAEKWWDTLDMKGSPGVMIEEHSLLKSREKCIVCRTLSGLRTAISQIREAKLETKPKRGQGTKLEKLSPWGIASAIVLQCAVGRRIFVCGQLRGDVGWCCEWMMGDMDEDTGPADCFMMDLPLKLLKGCAVSVIRNGTFAVRIDGTKALKLMNVAALDRKDLKIVVFKAGGESLKNHSRPRRAYSRYWQWRPFVAVVAADRSGKFWKSESILYLE